jgi:hypothetical protein
MLPFNFGVTALYLSGLKQYIDPVADIAFLSSTPLVKRSTIVPEQSRDNHARLPRGVNPARM